MCQLTGPGVFVFVFLKFSYARSGKVKRSQDDGEVLSITYRGRQRGGYTGVAPLLLTLGFRPEWDIKAKHSLLPAGQRVQVPMWRRLG
jgi:hypothetical protein